MKSKLQSVDNQSISTDMKLKALLWQEVIKHMLQWETITTKLQTQEFNNSNHQL